MLRVVDPIGGRDRRQRGRARDQSERTLRSRSPGVRPENGNRCIALPHSIDHRGSGRFHDRLTPDPGVKAPAVRDDLEYRPARARRQV